MSADRLEELRRQRALLEEHLNWLDREISAATPAGGAPASPPPPSPSSVPGPPDPTTPPAAPRPATPPSFVPAVTAPVAPAPVEADSILEQYQVAPNSLRQDVRKGCFLYFAVAFLLVIVGVAGIYLLVRR